MAKTNNIAKLASLFFEIGTLRKIPRAHQQALLSQDLSDNIASHSFRTTLIGYFLAKELKADENKVIKMCLWHDLEKARGGDQNWIHKKYVKVFEEEIRQEQLKGLTNSKELLELSKEYQQRKTLEAKIAKDADLLDETLILKEYYWQGNKEAESWLKLKGKNQQEKLMFTGLAKKIADEIKKQNPNTWWANSWTFKRK